MNRQSKIDFYLMTLTGDDLANFCAGASVGTCDKAYGYRRKAAGENAWWWKGYQLSDNGKCAMDDEIEQAACHSGLEW